VSTTTIRIDDTLKARLSAAAESAGTTTHAFILEAIERTVEQAEQEREFHELADARWTRLLETGKTVSWDEAKSYVAARVRGERPSKPTARKPKGA
jgi:predicted transcriptional regulator